MRHCDYSVHVFLGDDTEAGWVINLMFCVALVMKITAIIGRQLTLTDQIAPRNLF